MRLFSHPVALSLWLILAGALLLLSHNAVIHPAGIRNLWPLVLIAAGLEELYLWASTGERQ